MEEIGTINDNQRAKLPDFCKAMAVQLAQLVVQIPDISDRDIRELPLLTFGAQLQGSNNTEIGKKAMREVFASIAEIVGKHIINNEATRLSVKNASGRTVNIILGHDPDVNIVEIWVPRHITKLQSKSRVVQM